MWQMVNGDSPSYADIAKMKLREQNKIDLYPQEEDDEPEILKTLREHYELLEGTDRSKINNNTRLEYNDLLLKEILTEAINTMVIEPVLENNYPTSRDIMLSGTLVYDFVNEHNAYDLVRNFKYKNIYLAEIALVTESVYEELKSNKEITREDIEDIENGSIKDKILKKEAKLPKNVTNLISKRVEDSIDDFLSSKRDMDFKLRQIYDKAQAKVDQYNQEKEAMMNGQQSAVDTTDGADPELDVNALYNSKMDAQQAQEISNQGPDTGLGMQEQYMAEAKDLEYKELNKPYSIFDAIMRSIVESTYKNNLLRESYINENNDFDYQKLLNDTRTIYTFLECVNTLNMIDIDSTYLTNMLRNLQEQDTGSSVVSDIGNASKEMDKSSNSKSIDLGITPKDFGEKGNKIESYKFKD